jgi:hypothetical protein
MWLPAGFEDGAGSLAAMPVICNETLSITVDVPVDVAIDLAIVIDISASMGSSMAAIENAIEDIVNGISVGIVNEHPLAEVELRLAIVPYCDRWTRVKNSHPPGSFPEDILDFDTDAVAFETWIGNMIMFSGGSGGSEDLLTGIRVVIEELSWSSYYQIIGCVQISFVWAGASALIGREGAL